MASPIFADPFGSLLLGVRQRRQDDLAEATLAQRTQEARDAQERAALDRALRSELQASQQAFQLRSAEIAAAVADQRQLRDQDFQRGESSLTRTAQQRLAQQRDAAALSRLGITEASADRRFAVGQFSQTQRLNITEASADRRFNAGQQGQTDRLAITEASADRRFDAGQQGQTDRLAITEASAQARFETGQIAQNARLTAQLSAASRGRLETAFFQTLQATTANTRAEALVKLRAEEERALAEINNDAALERTRVNATAGVAEGTGFLQSLDTTSPLTGAPASTAVDATTTVPAAPAAPPPPPPPPPTVGRGAAGQAVGLPAAATVGASPTVGPTVGRGAVGGRPLTARISTLSPQAAASMFRPGRGTVGPPRTPENEAAVRQALDSGLVTSRVRQERMRQWLAGV